MTLKFAVAFLLAGANAFPAQASVIREAREALAAGDAAGAAARYSARAGTSEDVGLLGEYAYALSRAGLYDLALAQLDRGLHLDATDPAFLHFAAKVLEINGMDYAAVEIRRPAPAWIQGREPETTMKPERELGAFKPEFAAANILMRQRRFYSAAARFHRLALAFPKEELVLPGLAIALEKIGAYRSAAAAVAKDLELNPKMDTASRGLLREHQAELAARPPLRAPLHAKRPNEMLKGRYLCFLGGDYTKTDADQALTLRARAGKFLTNRFDVAVNAGLSGGHDDSDFNGIDFGISGRYQHPLPMDAPINAAVGARFAYVPGPGDKASMFLSPGLSYYLRDASIDLFVDIALSGPLKDSRTLSLGYTAYFGAAQQ